MEGLIKRAVKAGAKRKARQALVASTGLSSPAASLLIHGVDFAYRHQRKILKWEGKSQIRGLEKRHFKAQQDLGDDHSFTQYLGLLLEAQKQTFEGAEDEELTVSRYLWQSFLADRECARKKRNLRKNDNHDWKKAQKHKSLPLLE